MPESTIRCIPLRLQKPEYRIFAHDKGWAYLGTFVLSCGPYSLYVATHDPALFQRRTKVGPSQEEEPAQKIIVLFILAAFVALMILPPLDYRFGWSPVPWYAAIIGDLLVAFSFYVFYLVSKVNTYAAVRHHRNGFLASMLSILSFSRRFEPTVSTIDLFDWLSPRANLKAAVQFSRLTDRSRPVPARLHFSKAAIEMPETDV